MARGRIFKKGAFSLNPEPYRVGLQSRSKPTPPKTNIGKEYALRAPRLNLSLSSAEVSNRYYAPYKTTFLGRTGPYFEFKAMGLDGKHGYIYRANRAQQYRAKGLPVLQKRNAEGKPITIPSARRVEETKSDTRMAWDPRTKKLASAPAKGHQRRSKMRKTTAPKPSYNQMLKSIHHLPQRFKQPKTTLPKTHHAIVDFFRRKARLEEDDETVIYQAILTEADSERASANKRVTTVIKLMREAVSRLTENEIRRLVNFKRQAEIPISPYEKRQMAFTARYLAKELEIELRAARNHMKSAILPSKRYRGILALFGELEEGNGGIA